MKLVKDYATNYDVFSYEENLFSNEELLEIPFFMQLGEDGLCYNVNVSSKINSKPTYIYLNALKNRY